MLKLFRLLHPYRGYIAAALVLALAQSMGFLLPPRLMSDIVDKGIVRGNQRTIIEIGGLMLLVSIIATACAIAACASVRISCACAGLTDMHRSPAASVPVALKTDAVNGNYGVSHANFVLAYTKDNLAHVIYPGGIRRDDWVHDLPMLIRETWVHRPD